MNGLATNNVLVPVDFSDESFAAVDAAVNLAASAGNITIIHVLPDLQVNEPGMVWATVDDESRRKHVVESLEKHFADAKYQGLKFVVAFGDPGHEITRHAKESGTELIVLPSHGRTGLKHVLIGSVAERVVRLAHCPVLVLRK